MCMSNADAKCKRQILNLGGGLKPFCRNGPCWTPRVTWMLLQHHCRRVACFQNVPFVPETSDLSKRLVLMWRSSSVLPEDDVSSSSLFGVHVGPRLAPQWRFPPGEGCGCLTWLLCDAPWCRGGLLLIFVKVN